MPPKVVSEYQFELITVKFLALPEQPAQPEQPASVTVIPAASAAAVILISFFITEIIITHKFLIVKTFVP